MVSWSVTRVRTNRRSKVSNLHEVISHVLGANMLLAPMKKGQDPMRERDTMCSACGLYTHVCSPGGQGIIFCDRKCYHNYVARRGSIPSYEPYCIVGEGWYNKSFSDPRVRA